MISKPETFIFIGRSGCGKGTQVKLLLEFLKANDPQREIVHLETGKIFREFINGPTYTHGQSRDIYEKGGLQPEFLTVNMWSNFFIKEMKPDVHLVTDGTPRKPQEAEVLDSAVRFYRRGLPHLIFINVSRGWAEARLLGRGRVDDSKKDIASRLDWYETDVVQAIDFYRTHNGYHYHEIYGEQPVEKVHQEILQKTGLLS